MTDMPREEAQAVPAPYLPSALRGGAALPLFALAYLLTCFLAYLTFPGRIKPASAGTFMLGVLAAMTAAFMGWSGVWAAAGKIFRQKASFAAHLSVASVSFLAWNLMMQAVSAAVFSMDASSASRPAMLAAFWVCGVWALTCHLGLASRLRHRTTLIISLLLVTALSGGWLGFMHLAEKAMTSSKTSLDLWPPALLLVKGEPASEYAARLRGLRVKVDKAAAEAEN